MAKATGREFIRISLGGVRDEAEIRGHRRTYIGSMPGKIIQSMKKAKTTNPLILLDEIDKMGQDFRGDPASAMLEVLDPEQNATFSDHYLEVEYDLSNVMFITTANSYNMPRPLLDRMEIIPIPGYTEDEKIEIAKQHLIDKQEKGHGLKPAEFELTDEGLRDIVRYYTREAGVRNLEREIAKLCRKAVTEIVKGNSGKVMVTPANLEEYPRRPAVQVRARRDRGPGRRRHRPRLDRGRRRPPVDRGAEAARQGADEDHGQARRRDEGVDRRGRVLGALEGARPRAEAADVRDVDIHVHVPEGATPKDGPSAGIAMVTSIVSVLTGIPVRRDVAMTGEVTLRGNVLPIGGLKEKLLAALRGGITTVMIPSDNVKDLREIPDNVKNGLELIPVSNVTDVLKQALVRTPEPIEWDEAAEAEKLAATPKPGGAGESPTPAH